MKKAKPYLLCALWCVIILAHHLLDMNNSMVNFSGNGINPERAVISEGYLESVVAMHERHPAFVKRPVMTAVIRGLQDWTPLSVGWAFVVANFGFLWLAGIELFRFSREWLNDRRQALISVGAFYLSFSVWFAFYPPVYSYDEPLQYALLFGALHALFKLRWWAFVGWFSASLVVRESGLILLPSIALFLIPGRFVWGEVGKKPFWTRIWVSALPVVLYGAFVVAYVAWLDLGEETSSDITERFAHANFNFQSFRHSFESVFSLFFAVGWALYVWVSYRRRAHLSPQQQNWSAAFVLAMVINTAVVLLTTLARETRLFALPLVFLWPWLGHMLSSEWARIREQRLVQRVFTHWASIVLWVIWAGGVVFLIDRVYKPTDAGKSGSFQDEYAALVLLMMGIHALGVWRSSSSDGLQAMKK